MYNCHIKYTQRHN